MNNRGFSLIELLIAIAIFGILLTALTAFFISQNRQYVVQSQIVEMQDNARFAMDIIVRILRNSEVASSPPYGTDCTSDYEIGVQSSGNEYSFKLENNTLKFKNPQKSPNWQELVENIYCFKVDWDSDDDFFYIKIEAKTARILPGTGQKKSLTLESTVKPRNKLTFNTV